MPSVALRETNVILSEGMMLSRYHELVPRVTQRNDASIVAVKWLRMVRRVLKKPVVGKAQMYVRAMRAAMMGGLDHPLVALQPSRFTDKADRRYAVYNPVEYGDDTPSYRRVTISPNVMFWRNNLLNSLLCPTLPVLARCGRKTRSFRHKQFHVSDMCSAERLDRYMPSITRRMVSFQITPYKAILNYVDDYVDETVRKMVCLSSRVLSEYNIPPCLADLILRMTFERDEDGGRMLVKQEMFEDFAHGLYYTRYKKRPYTSIKSTLDHLRSKALAERTAQANDRQIEIQFNFNSIRTVTDLENLSVKYLKVLCRVRDVKGYSKLRRRELVAYIAKELELDERGDENEVDAPTDDRSRDWTQYSTMELKIILKERRIKYRDGDTRADLIHLCQRYLGIRNND